MARVRSQIDGDMVFAGGREEAVKFAFANIATGTTDGALVTAVSGRRIRVLAASAKAGATATAITFNSKPAGAGTAISALFANGASGDVTLPFSPTGWFQTAVGEGLTATTSAAGATTGVQIVYVEV